MKDKIAVILNWSRNLIQEGRAQGCLTGSLPERTPATAVRSAEIIQSAGKFGKQDTSSNARILLLKRPPLILHVSGFFFEGMCGLCNALPKWPGAQANEMIGLTRHEICVFFG